MSITIRTLTDEPADIEAAHTILSAAFKAQRSFRDEVRRYLSFQMDGFFLALWEGEPAGMGGAVNFGPFAYIGMVGVPPAMQRRGIGQAVMEHVLAWLDAGGCPLAVLDASAAGAPLYARLGFAEVRQVFDFRPRETFSGPPSSDGVQPLRLSDLSEVADFDEAIFGVRREKILAAYLADYPQRGFVVRDAGGHITGYLIAQWRCLGPWIAQEPQAAAVLLQAARSLTYDEMFRVLVPSSNVEAARLLTDNGFQKTNTLSYMQRGGLPEPGDHRLLYGQISHAIG